jgi:hypothetical protein
MRTRYVSREDIAPLLDGRGRVMRWPAKAAKREAVLQYLAGRFEAGLNYTERQVNDVLLDWHTFGDFVLLRRELCDHRFLARTPDGSRYWVAEP